MMRITMRRVKGTLFLILAITAMTMTARPTRKKAMRTMIPIMSKRTYFSTTLTLLLIIFVHCSDGDGPHIDIDVVIEHGHHPMDAAGEPDGEDHTVDGDGEHQLHDLNDDNDDQADDEEEDFDEDAPERFDAYYNMLPHAASHDGHGDVYDEDDDEDDDDEEPGEDHDDVDDAGFHDMWMPSASEAITRRGVPSDRTSLIIRGADDLPMSAAAIEQDMFRHMSGAIRSFEEMSGGAVGGTAMRMQLDNRQMMDFIGTFLAVYVFTMSTLLQI